MTNTGTALVGRRAPRWMVAALIGSLAVNLLVVGLVVGASWRGRNTVVCRGPAPNLLGYASTLPPERHKALWARTTDHRHQVRPFRRDVRSAREETIVALEAEPFDRPRYTNAQALLAEAYSRAQMVVQSLNTEIAAAMTPEERRGFRRWREHLRPPGHNVLDEPEQQAK